MLVGVPTKDAVFTTKPINLLNERTLKGTFFGNYKPRTDLPSVVDMYMNKVIMILSTLKKPYDKIFGHVKSTLTPFLFLDYLQTLELDKFITHRVPFSDINKAFDLMLKGEGLRCIMSMED